MKCENKKNKKRSDLLLPGADPVLVVIQYPTLGIYNQPEGKERI
jgi:hypothetical protein